MIKKLLQNGLMLAVAVVMAGSVQAQTWDFEDQSLDIWEARVELDQGYDGTAEVTDDRSEEGTYSVKLSATSETANAMFRATSGLENLEPGSKLTFRVWVSDADAAYINGLQPIAQHGDGWGGWTDAWYGMGDIDLDAWNTITLELPEPDDGVFQQIGLQITGLDAGDTPEIFIDKVTIEAPTDESETVLYTWDFEDQDLGNWVEQNSTLTITDDRSESGTYSVKLEAGDDGNESWMRNETDFDQLEEGVIIRYRFWIDEENLEYVNGFQTFFVDPGWNADWHNAGDQTPGEWNTIEYTVHDISDLDPSEFEAFGLQIVRHGDAAGYPTIYVDKVSLIHVEEEEPEIDMINIFTHDFEDQELGDWHVGEQADGDDASGGTATITDDRSDEGTWSVQLTASDDQQNVQFRNEVAVDEVQELDQLSFRIWVSADDLENIEWIGPAVRHGVISQGWDYAAYTADDLEADAWNTVTLDLPVLLNGIGDYLVLHVEGKDAADTPSVYIDWVSLDRPDFPDPADVVSRPDPGNLLFGFEEDEAGDTQGWQATEAAENLSSTDAWSSEGDYAIVADFPMDGETDAILEVENNDGWDLSAATHLSAIVRHSDDGTAVGMTAQLFVKTGGDWVWFEQEAKEIGSEEEDGYILLFDLADVDDLADVRAIGVKFVSGEGSSDMTHIYVDNVRTHPADTDEMELPDASDILYSFEGGDLQGWGTEGDNVRSVGTTDSWSSHGDYSQFTDLSFDNLEYHFRVSYGAENHVDKYANYTHLSAVVRHDGEAPNYGDGGVNANLYIMTDGWSWQDGGATLKTVTSAEEGTLLTFDLSDVQDLDVVYAFGVKFEAGPNAAGPSRFFLDEVRGYYEAETTGADNEVAGEFRLRQNYPNPFNPTTMISFEVPSATEVALNVYDILGQRVMTLVNEEVSSGVHQVQFDGSQLASGVYIYRIEAGDFVKTRKMMLIK